jgi:hypothetical protein
LEIMFLGNKVQVVVHCLHEVIASKSCPLLIVDVRHVECGVLEKMWTKRKL